MKRLFNVYVAGLGQQVARRSGLNRMRLGGEPDAAEPDGTREKSKNHSYDIFLGRQLSKGAPDEVILNFNATYIPSHGDQD